MKHHCDKYINVQFVDPYRTLLEYNSLWTGKIMINSNNFCLRLYFSIINNNIPVEFSFIIQLQFASYDLQLRLEINFYSARNFCGDVALLNNFFSFVFLPLNFGILTIFVVYFRVMNFVAWFWFVEFTLKLNVVKF